MINKTIMNFKMRFANMDVDVSENIESLIRGLNNGVGYDVETRSGYTQVLRVEVKDAASRYNPELVMSDTGGHFIQLLQDDGESSPESAFLPSRHYVIGYIFESLMEIEEAKKIEKALSERVLRKFEHIDTLNGYAKGMLQARNNILKGEVYEYKYNHHFLKREDFDEETLRKERLEDLVNQTRLASRIGYDEATEAQLLDMAKFAKKNKLKPENKKVFNRLAYGLFNHKGEYSEDVAATVVDAIGGDGNYDKYINAEFRSSTVASFIKWVSDNGYEMNFIDRYFEEMTDEEVDIVKEDPTIIAKYISSKDMCDLMHNGYRNILVDSPTGSGKTTATAEAAKVWMDVDKKNRIFVFLLPTTSLVRQTAKDKNMGEGLYGRKSTLEVMMNNYSKTGYRQVAATYDKAFGIMEYIQYHNPGAEVLIVVDEAHKEVSDYDFRRPAIRSVAKAKEHKQTVKFIGLSGTPQEIDKSGYDQMVTFEPKNKETIFKNLLILEYSETKEFIQSTTKTIVKGVESGRNVVAFIQNTDLLEDTKKGLDKANIRSSVVKSDIKDEEGQEVYDHLIDEQVFKDGVQVLLSTNFIADGINILNDTDKYDVIIAPDRTRGPIFNLSQIKQMSNRLRNRYENLIIPLFISKTIEKERLEHTEPFGFETRFKKVNYKNNRAAQDLRERFGDRLEEYHPGELERALTLPHMNIYADSPFHEELGQSLADFMKEYRHYKNKPGLEPSQHAQKVLETGKEMEDALFTGDRRASRKIVSKEQENYYARFPMAFVRALEVILEAEAQHMYLHDYVEGISAGKQALIDSHFPELEELRKASEEKKRENFEKVFTREVYEELRYDLKKNKGEILTDTKLYTELEEHVSKLDMGVITNHLPFAGYDMILKVAKETSNKNEQSKFKRRFKAKRKLDGWSKASEKVDTHKVVDMLKDAIADEDYYMEDAKGRKILSNKILKDRIIPVIIRTIDGGKSEVKQSDIINILNEYFVFDTVKVTINKKSVRGKTNIELVSEESIAREYGADVVDIRKAYKEYIFEWEQKHAA